MFKIHIWRKWSGVPMLLFLYYISGFFPLYIFLVQTSHVLYVSINSVKLNTLQLGKRGTLTAGRFISPQHRPESWKHALRMLLPNFQSQPHISKPGMLTGQTYPHMPPSLHSNKVKVKVATHIFSWCTFLFSSSPLHVYLSLYPASRAIAFTLSPPPHFLPLLYLRLIVPMQHCHLNIWFVTQDTIALYIQYSWGKFCYVHPNMDSWCSSIYS